MAPHYWFRVVNVRVRGLGLNADYRVWVFGVCARDSVAYHRVLDTPCRLKRLTLNG